MKREIVANEVVVAAKAEKTNWPWATVTAMATLHRKRGAQLTPTTQLTHLINSTFRDAEPDLTELKVLDQRDQILAMTWNQQRRVWKLMLSERKAVAVVEPRQ